MKQPFSRSPKNQLHDHIRSQLGAGVNLDAIIKNLREVGWQDAEIQSAMEQLNRETREMRKDEIEGPRESHKKRWILVAFTLVSIIVLYFSARYIMNLVSNSLDDGQPAPLSDDIQSASDLFDNPDEE